MRNNIDDLLADLGSAAIIKTETVIAGSPPCVVITVWYEPPEAD